MKALIVEDEFVCRHLLQSILTPHGEVHVATKGNEAVAAFRIAHEQGKPYDLICLDIMMPDMNGQEVLQVIRQLEEQRGIQGLDGVKVIMTTALSDSSTILNAFKSQCEAYLIKPIKKAELLDKLRELGLVRQEVGQ